MIVHIDVLKPTFQETHSEAISSITRCFFDAISRTAVDIFVLISGWFGIRPKLHNMSRLIFQILFFSIGIYIIALGLGVAPFSIKEIARSLCMLNSNWFVVAYIFLCVLAPCLNAYIEKASEQQFVKFIIVFFTLQTIYGWFPWGGASYFSLGFSPLSFVGLYMLGQYVHIYTPGFTQLKKSFDLGIIIALLTFNTVSGYLAYFTGHAFATDYIYAYNSPVVILCALYVIILFSKLHFKSRGINFIAASVFAVFLFHYSPYILDTFYKPSCHYLFLNTNGILCILSFIGFLIATFIAAIFIDQSRILIWNKLGIFS